MQNSLFFIFQTNYKAGDYIVRQGAYGDTFFIISQGRVSKDFLWIPNEAKILFNNIEIFDNSYKQRSIFFGTRHANDDVEKVFLVIFIMKSVSEINYMYEHGN